MSVLVFIDADKQQQPTSYALQAASYAARLAEQLQTDCVAVSLCPPENVVKQIGAMGLKELTPLPYHPLEEAPILFALEQVVASCAVHSVVFSHDFAGKSLAPQLALRLEASLATACIDLPAVQEDDTWHVKRNIFSGKATQTLSLLGTKKVITIQPNAFEVLTKNEVVETQIFSPKFSAPPSSITDMKTIFFEGASPLSDAARVVSGGMGMQSPDHWHLLEKLAQKMDASLACTRLVSDAGWRPHHEHVGQTGTTIAPQLYVAVGISGAIQHVAGINQSKIIVAINNDPEAPIFKIANYGIVGDALEVLPRLLQA